MTIANEVGDRLLEAGERGATTDSRLANEQSQPEAVAPDRTARIGEDTASFAHWESPRPISAAMHAVLTGNPDLPPATWFLSTYGPFQRVADIGAGDCILTHVILASDPGVKVDAYDASSASLETGKARLKDVPGALERTLFIRTDLNSEPLAEGIYDAVMTSGAMHHLENLDFCFASIRRALRADGILWLNDYIGPGRFQWSDTQMRLANELLAMVPRRWRRREHVTRYSDSLEGSDAPGVGPYASEVDSTLRAHFEVERVWARGGTLLAPIFGSGCLSPDMLNDAEGRVVLAALYATESQLISSGVIANQNAVYIARPRPNTADLVAAAFRLHIPEPGPVPELGIQGDVAAWIAFNRTAIFTDDALRMQAAPFAPPELMMRTTGLTRPEDFAAHCTDLLTALSASVPKPLADYAKVLDFGVGVGRAARMFKGTRGAYVGVDIDADNIAWVDENLPWVEARLTQPGKPFPPDLGGFDLVISISVFTHMDRESFDFYVAELARVTQAGGHAAITFQGRRVVERAFDEAPIQELLAVPLTEIEAAHAALERGSGFYFAEQYTHLTSEEYRYGLAFVTETFVREAFAPFFDVERYVPAAIHDFQDLAILKRL